MSTSAKRNNSSSNNGKRAIDRPFNASHLRKAESAVDSYRFVGGCEPEGDFTCQWVEYPGVIGIGATFTAAIQHARELLITTIAHDLERGEQLQTPVTEEYRTIQVNIRLTAVEKLTLEAEAKQKGFRSMSDYIRTLALNYSAIERAPGSK